MRLRFNKNAKSFLDNNPNYYLNTSDNEQINLPSLFNNSNPIYLEIGCGKGNFIIENAKQNPNINYIGFEKNETILMKAINKVLENNLPNLKFIGNDANNIDLLFANNSISKIFLNFSDPWPKARHTKRRLTHPSFLTKFQKILVPNGNIELKTDNDGLFTYTYDEVLSVDQDKYDILYCTKNLYENLNDDINKSNIPTEYETKFHNLGKNIYKIIFKFK